MIMPRFLKKAKKVGLSPGALVHVGERKIEETKITILDYDQVLGLDLDKVDTDQALPDNIQALVDARKQARKDKEWARSDQLRDEIQALGYVVQDGPQGMKVFKQ